VKKKIDTMEMDNFLKDFDFVDLFEFYLLPMRIEKEEKRILDVLF